MYSENGVLIDFDEVTKLIRSADVFAVAFSHFPQRLIVDTRSNESETPLITVSEPKSSAKHRIAWLSRRRPTLGPPRAFSLVVWPHSPRLLTESGVWDRVRERVGAGIDPQVDVQCDLALKQLRALDREAMLALIRGDDCATLWPPESMD